MRRRAARRGSRRSAIAALVPSIPLPFPMLGKLFLLFTVVTLIEVWLLAKLAALMGWWGTLGLVFVTGFVGAWLAKREGLRALGRIRGELHEGKLPGGSLIDGLCILVAGAFLMTPGVLTDAFGFLLLIPPARAPLKRYLKARFEKWLANGEASVFTMGMGNPTAGFTYRRMDMNSGPRPADFSAPRDQIYRDGDVIDVTAE